MKIETGRDVTFDEVSSYNKSKTFHIEDVEEPEVPKTKDTTMEEMTQENHEDHDMAEPQEPVDPPHEKNSYKRRPTWAREAIQDAERYGVPDGTLRESKRPRPYSTYVALLCDIINNEPSTMKKLLKKKEWKEAMIKEDQSIMKNDVQEIVLRPEKKYAVTSKWIYKIKHDADGSIEKYRERFVARGLSHK